MSCLAIFGLQSCEKEDAPIINEPTPQELPTAFTSWKNLFDGEGVGAIHGHGDVTFIFNSQGTQYAWFEDNEIRGIRNLKATNSHFQNLPLQTVGAIGRIKETGETNNSIMVYNKAGTRYTIITPPTKNAGGYYNDLDYFAFSTTSYTPYDMWTDGSYPLNDVDAILADYSSSGNNGLVVYFTKKGGSEYCYLLGNNPPLFSSVFNANKLIMLAWSNGDTQVPMNMTTIGAMSTVKVNSQTRYKVFFTADGKQFKVWNQFDASPSELFDLY